MENLKAIRLTLLDGEMINGFTNETLIEKESKQNFWRIFCPTFKHDILVWNELQILDENIISADVFLK